MHNSTQENKGTSAIHVFGTILPVFFTIFLASIITTVIRINNLKFLIEFFLISFTIILQVTLLNSSIIYLNFSLVLISILLIVITLRDNVNLYENIKITTEFPGYITLMRASVFLITAVCILAVDFNMFPISLSKTDTYGFGLMDTGIGLFVFSTGIVSSKPEILELRRLLKGTIPLLVLGIARTVVTKMINYQENVTEYGLHWNAFITLACVRIITSVLEGLMPHIKPKYFAICISLLHELVIQLGVGQYILDPKGDRLNFINANREGIFSIPGFIALHMGSVYIGYAARLHKKEVNFWEFLQKMKELGTLSVGLWVALFVLDFLFGTSRRICNIGYIVWVLSIGATMTTIFMFLELYHVLQMKKKEPQQKADYVPLIMKSINFNSLFFFLFANLLTGFVNIVFTPNKMNNVMSILIMLIYLFVICVVNFIFYSKKIKLKI